MQDKKHQSDKRTALIGTLAVHALLLILLVSFSVKQPHYEEPAVEQFDVMLGEDDLGDGLGENTEVARPASSSERSYSSNSSSPRVTETIVSNSSNPNISASRSRNTTRTTPNNSASRSTNTSSSSNTRSGEGTEPKPKATLGSRNSGPGVGRGSGNGQGESGTAGIQGRRDGSVSYSLGQRKLVARPSSYESFSQSGTVRVQIYVDRAGNIIRHRVLSSSSSELSNLAVAKLSQVKFNRSTQAPPEQQGTLTFKFQLR